jgi:hypothetical protein
VLVDLGSGGEAVVDELVAHLFDAVALAFVAGRPGGGEVGVGGHVDQAGLPQAAGQRAAVGKIGAMVGEQSAELRLEPVGQFLGGAGVLEADQGL